MRLSPSRTGRRTDSPVRIVLSSALAAPLPLAVSFVILTAQAAERPIDTVRTTFPVHDPVGDLIEEHGCWTGSEQPPLDMAGVLPTHAIVGGRYVGGRLASQAFDQEIGGRAHGLQVSAFCR